MDGHDGAQNGRSGPSIETLADIAFARLTGPIRKTGLTVLYQPSRPHLDVAFVHGVTGHPEWTWVYKGGDIRNTGYRIGTPGDGDDRPFGCENDHDHDGGDYVHDNSNINFHEESSPAVYWPRDLISTTAPYARIYTYGYETNLSRMANKVASRNTLYDIAWDLLVALEVARRSTPQRPVVFIAHSLGGIVVQEMLRRNPRRFLQEVTETIVRASKLEPNEEAICDFLPSSDRLRRLGDEFGPMACVQKWKIHSFQEEFCLDNPRGRKVVKDTFSHLNCPAIEVRQYVKANHMDMCRFTGLEDPEYRKVATAFNRIVHSIIEKVVKDGVTGGKSDISFPNPEASLALTKEQKRSLLDSLRFNHMEARQMSIKSAYAKTCNWLLKKTEYIEWADLTKLEQHHGFLWIKGKPGTGKSVLMKYALGNLRNAALNRTRICFFFNARGNELEKSTLGMYRSLLVQLYEKLPRLQKAFDALGLSPNIPTQSLAWGIETLKDLFEQTIRLLGSRPVVCCIDALDECEEGQIRDMVGFFLRLGDVARAIQVRFWVLFTSRHYPHITINKGLHLVLESQEGHDQDISEYIENMSTIGDGEMASKLKRDIQTKASGVFMWVVLVVEILNKEHDEGRTMRRLQKTLSAIPDDLHELFRDILTRDTRNKNELLLCLQWLLFTARPLTPEELYFAIVSGTDPDEVLPWDTEELPMDSIAKFILNSSKGLAECTSSKQPTVQFIHESVRDFLLKEDGLKTVWSDLGVSFQGESHDRLARCCRRYLDGDIMSALSLPYSGFRKIEDVRQTAVQKFPFLDYSVQNIFYHSDFAESEDTSQEEFLNDLPLANWIRLYNVFRGKGLSTPYSSRASLFYVLAETNRPSLIERHFSRFCCFQVEGERYGTPIFAALGTGNNELVTIMLSAQAARQPSDQFLDDILRPYTNLTKQFTRMEHNFYFNRCDGTLHTVAHQGDEVIFAFYLAANPLQLDQQDQFRRTPLSYAAEKGHRQIVKRLLETHRVSVDSESQIGRTPLSYAAEHGHVSIVRMLAGEDGVDPDSKSESRRTPLSYATEKGHEQVVSTLLAIEGVDPDSKEACPNRTPLRYAVEQGHEAIARMLLSTTGIKVDSKDLELELTCLLWATDHQKESMVKLLLDKDANVEATTQTGRTALALAAKNGNGAIAGLLLDKGADVNALDNLGWTPLLIAAQAGHIVVLRLLVENNSNIETTDGQFGRSPLSWAAGNGHVAVVQFLLERGANAESADRFGRTPSNWASSQGQMATLWELMTTYKRA
ncbi:hypothetical protein F5Y10DRAFT_291744 [Nemania abortiva]|nr:hypothetical protein F5Y10DRAFT_291744 [Nemania abortiva]